MALRLADESTKKIDLGDGDWVKVREDISKRSMNRLIARMPKRTKEEVEKDGLSISEGLEFQVGVFEALVTEWSLPVPPTAEAYLNIKREDVETLDELLVKHFEALMPSKEEQGKQ